MTALLAIGTSEGLFLARSEDDRRSWQISGQYFGTAGVYAVGIDKRPSAARLLAGTSGPGADPSVSTSDDLGGTWRQSPRSPAAFPPGTGDLPGRIWQLAPGPADQPGRVYAGTEPSALFLSDDGGATFDLVDGLWEHPHRPDWGAGFGGQAVHTILPYPGDPTRLLVAISNGGVYRSADAGLTWIPANTGIRADFLPDPFPEFGQCVHKVVRDAIDPDRLYARNHNGVYRSDDDAGRWHPTGDGLPSDSGLAMVAHPWRGDVIYTFPLQPDGLRYPPGYRCRVYRSVDAGRSWEALAKGLPEGPFYSGVLRDAMGADDAPQTGIYFGTRSGEVFASRDEGDSWSLVAAHLPEVFCVRAALV